MSHSPCKVLNKRIFSVAASELKIEVVDQQGRLDSQTENGLPEANCCHYPCRGKHRWVVVFSGKAMQSPLKQHPQELLCGCTCGRWCRCVTTLRTGMISRKIRESNNRPVSFMAHGVQTQLSEGWNGSWANGLPLPQLGKPRGRRVAHSPPDSHVAFWPSKLPLPLL